MYIRAVVRHVCKGLVYRLERRPVGCAEEKIAVSSLISVLLHRIDEAVQEPAGVRMAQLPKRVHVLAHLPVSYVRVCA